MPGQPGCFQSFLQVGPERSVSEEVQLELSIVCHPGLEGLDEEAVSLLLHEAAGTAQDGWTLAGNHRLGLRHLHTGADQVDGTFRSVGRSHALAHQPLAELVGHPQECCPSDLRARALAASMSQRKPVALHGIPAIRPTIIAIVAWWAYQ